MSTEKLKSDEEKINPEENKENEGSIEQEENTDEESESEEIDSVEVITPDENQVRIDTLENDLEDKSKEVDELTARLRSVSAAYTRQGDEIKATKSRLERQMQYTESKNRGEVVSKLFEPFDNLKRCLEGLQSSDIDQSHIEGLEMVKSAFMSAFQKLGLEEIPGKGSIFNPNIHEALVNIPVPDPALNGVVVDVHSTGYRINDIIIKPAKVIVGHCEVPKEEPIQEEQEEQQENNAEEKSEDVVIESTEPTDNNDE
jgi:molecular chaperone GrpE